MRAVPFVVRRRGCEVLAVSRSAPRNVLRALEKVLFLACEGLHVTGPLLAVIALHGLAFVVGIDERELHALTTCHTNVRPAAR